MKGIQKVLFDLPIYGSEECANVDCSRPAVVRHPETGKFYCAGDAWQLMQSDDVRMAIKIRRYLLDAEAGCVYCDKPAERMCSVCQRLICFDHFKLIPRTGCACPECSAALEQEVAS